jgi:hypothetical protein
MQSVEGVEEGLLSLIFSLQELNVVNQQNVNIPIFGLKSRASVVLDGINEVVRELFGGNVANLNFWIKAQGIVANGMQKVCLTKSRSTVYKQRVICLGWSFGDSECSRVSESVGTSGNEVVEVVFGV